MADLAEGFNKPISTYPICLNSNPDITLWETNSLLLKIAIYSQFSR